MKVLSRNNITTKDYDRFFIMRAVKGAQKETKDGASEENAQLIADKVSELLVNEFGKDGTVNIETIQDTIESVLRTETSIASDELYKKYVIYRYNRSMRRAHKKDNQRMLTDDFISKFKHLASPMKQLGIFVYTRTYSRWLEEEGRREYWWETVRRAVEYNCSLVKTTTRREAEELFENIFYLRQFLSGRTFWVGNSPVSKDYPMGNFNCAFRVADNISVFSDVFYLLMIGSGVGYRILKDDVRRFPKMRANYEIIHDYVAKEIEDRENSTSLEMKKDTAKIIVGDSKEGWKSALKFYFNIIAGHDAKHIKRIIVDYSNVRPKGEKLKRFGGTASGHESLKTMFIKMDIVIKNRAKLKNNDYAKLKPIDVLDLLSIIAENVVSGGVRRSSLIALIDETDEECINAKTDMYAVVDGLWIPNKDLLHRAMSNNSIFYTKKPSRERLNWQLNKMRYSGEPAWVNAEQAIKRFPEFKGVNPCGEILLDSKGMCNLTTINAFAFVTEENTLDLVGILNAQRLSVRAGYRLTGVEMELHEWDEVLHTHKIIGASLTGWQDMVNAIDMSKEEEAELLKQLRQTAHNEAERIAKENGTAVPILVTTVKPEGTLSQLPTVSSGLHYSHSPYYIRRVRISATDPLLMAVQDLDWTIKPEVGYTMENASTMVVEFPVKAPEGKTKYDVSAIEQLENYKMFMENYVDHNASITVHVRDDEWEAVEDWVWENWDMQVGISFLSLDDNYYDLLPYEQIDEDEYHKRVSEMAEFIPSYVSLYEKHYNDLADIGSDCASGACPVR